MKDLPFFTSSEGIASLVLSEIPVSGNAYVIVRSVFTTTDALCKDCAGLCTAAGARQVVFSGNGDFRGRRTAACIIWRSIERAALPDTEAVAVLTDAPEWASRYRERFRHILTAKTYAATPEGACWVTKGGRRIALGLVSGGVLAAVATLKRGSGADCVCALAALLPSDEIRLLCAMENRPAMALYDRLGFSMGGLHEIWYF